jgi:hypothetical protein
MLTAAEILQSVIQTHRFQTAAAAANMLQSFTYIDRMRTAGTAEVIQNTFHKEQMRTSAA